MSIKTTGAEWKHFYKDPTFWPEGVWHEDEVITVNGEQVDEYDFSHEDVGDEDRMTIDGGYVAGLMGKAEPPSLEAYFKRWRKLQRTAFGAVDCPKDKVEAVKASIIAAGGKVTGLAP